MKTIRLFVVVGLLGLAQNAFAAKPCEELKSEIDAKFQAKGVQNYRLDIVANGAPDSGKTIGTCGGGTQHISYQRGVNASNKTSPEVKTTVNASAPASAVAPK